VVAIEQHLVIMIGLQAHFLKIIKYENIMKKLLFLLIFSTHSQAGDLMFKNGFEESTLIGGSASGITSSGLTLNLNIGSSNEVIALDTNGLFLFFMDVTAGQFYTVSILTLPSSPNQSCSLSNASGTVPSTGVNNVTVSCDGADKWNEMNWNSGNWN
jgi:hypothetical protein